MDYFQLQKLPLNFSYFLSCPLCSPVQHFKSLSLLKTHLGQQHVSKHLTPAKRLSAVERHLDKLTASCDLCQGILPKYKHSERFQEHKFLHYGIRPYKCDICQCSATTKSGILDHVRRHLRRIEKLGCLICTENFDTTELKDDHLRKCHAGAFISCEKCDMKFVDDKSFQKHVKKEHLGNNFVIECPRCPAGIRFPNEKVLALHQQQHLKEDKIKKKFACQLCERKFNAEHMFKAHLKAHKENRLKACKICGKTVYFKANEKDSNHTRGHLKNKPENLKCDECGAEFQRKSELTNHIRWKHNENESSCHICGKMMKPVFLTQHLRTCIGGDFKCAHCEMGFKNKSERFRHTKDTHTGWKCHRCDVAFKNEVEWRFHMKKDPEHKKTAKIKESDGK